MLAKSRSAVSIFHWLCQAVSPYVSAEKLQKGLPERESDLAALYQLASHNMVLPGLYTALQAKYLLGHFPEEFCDALEGFYQLNALHNARLRQQMISVSRLMNNLGVVPVWLKGATNLLAADWQSSARMMMDLDFWVPDVQCHAAVLRCLEDAGYEVSDAYDGMDYSEHHHFFPMMRSGQPASLEIHRQIVEATAAELMNEARALSRVEWISWEGLSIGQLSPPDRLMQSYIQCTEMNERGMARGHIGLMKTLDFVERAQAIGGIYPAEFLSKIAKKPWEDNARCFLSFVDRDFGLPSPLAPDDSFRRRQECALKFPRAIYAWFIFEHAYDVLSSGQAGAPRDWWPKLVKHLRALRNSSVPN